MKILKSYNELLTYDTFEDRLRYLKLDGAVGEQTFGSNRWLNQKFYMSYEWRKFRDEIIIRDNGCDMALEDYIITPSKKRGIIIHHINPCTVEDFEDISKLMDPNNVVCVSYRTHRFIHYGTDIPEYCESIFVEDRKPNDTCPWRN